MAPKPARTGRPRPPTFRALGSSDPPAEVSVGKQTYQFVEVFKHDSWAATAKYAGAGRVIVCKFHRTQSIARVPMARLGRWLADRERNALDRLADLPNVPTVLGAVAVDGRIWPNAVARVFVPGHPLRPGEKVSSQFFPELDALLRTMHERGIAYVDLHKRENILVGDDGRPHLIDFQIGFDVTGRFASRVPGIRAAYDLLCRSDLYHLQKHVTRHTPGGGEIRLHPPFWIRAHRVVAVPFRTGRRKLLVAVGIRSGKGRVETEHFAEDAVRDVRHAA